MEVFNEVSFEEAGDGFVLRMENKEAKLLYKKYKDEYINTVTTGLLRLDFDIMQFCMDIALRNEKGELISRNIEDIKLPLEKVREKLLDCYSLCINGRTWEDQLAFVQADVEKRQKGLEPERPTSL